MASIQGWFLASGCIFVVGLAMVGTLLEPVAALIVCCYGTLHWLLEDTVPLKLFDDLWISKPRAIASGIPYDTMPSVI